MDKMKKYELCTRKELEDIISSSLFPYKDYGILNKQYLYDKLREVD